ncbi:MAG TPA: hypothetical protein VG710_17515 [Opitutus sp.]|nr:hypothetical protein [Opitutus sp.]
MKPMSRLSAPLATILLATTFLAIEPGCTTPQKSAAQQKSDADDPWVTLPPKLGSNVPRRVRRSQLTAEEAASASGNVSSEDLMRNVRPESVPSNVRSN